MVLLGRTLSDRMERIGVHDSFRERRMSQRSRLYAQSGIGGDRRSVKAFPSVSELRVFMFGDWSRWIFRSSDEIDFCFDSALSPTGP